MNILEYLKGQPIEQSWAEIKKAVPEAEFEELTKLLENKKAYRISKGETLYYWTFNL